MSDREAAIRALAMLLHESRGTHNINRWQRAICHKPDSDAHTVEAANILGSADAHPAEKAALAAWLRPTLRERGLVEGGDSNEWDRVVRPAYAATPTPRVPDELRALSEAATPGPWSHWRHAASKTNEVQSGRRPPIVFWSGFDRSERPEPEHAANARLIVAAANWIRELLR